VKPVKKKAPAVAKVATSEVSVASEPGKAAVKSVKAKGPRAQKKVSTTPSYKVGAKAAGGKAAAPRRPSAGSRTVRGNTGPGRPKGR
jgi:GTP-binding protein